MNEDLLLKYLRDIIDEIIFKVGDADLMEDERAMRLVEEIGGLLDQFGITVDQVIPEMIIKEYFGGVENAEKALKLSKVAVKPIQRRVHMEAVEEILEDTLMDFHAAIRTAKANTASSINDTLGKVKGDIAKGIIAGNPRKVIQAQVAKSFAENGLTAFTTTDNRRLPLDFYSMTVTRYKMREAAVTGAVKRYEENDQDLVRITGNSDSCPVCARYRGMVVSLNGETPGYPVVGENDIRLPAYHPNCRCSVQPFVEEFKSNDEIEEAMKRNAAYSPGVDPRTPAQKRAYEWEQKQRRIANAEKKQYARWKMALGDDAPKTLGAFRRMKRQNTANFQKMQSEYRSIMRRSAE